VELPLPRAIRLCERERSIFRQNCCPAGKRLPGVVAVEDGPFASDGRRPSTQRNRIPAAAPNAETWNSRVNLGERRFAPNAGRKLVARSFATEQDVSDARTRWAVVNQTFVNRYLAGQDRWAAE